MEREQLKPFGNVIQTCPNCGRFDVYLNDGHRCNRATQEYQETSQDYYD